MGAETPGQDALVHNVLLNIMSLTSPKSLTL